MSMHSLSRRGFVAGGVCAAGLLAGSSSNASAGEESAKVSSDPDGDVYSVAVPLKTPKSGKDKRMPRPLESAPCSVFIPKGVRTLRGTTLNPFYEPTVKQKHWRAAASLWDFAHVGLNFFGVKKDEQGETVLKALEMLGQASGHPELAHAPLCIHGMSIGGGLTSQLVQAFPSRVIAAAPVCLEVGPRDTASGGVPMITVFGEKDGRQMEKLSTKLPLARADHAQWAICPQWNRKHEWHMANNIILPFYEQVIAHRLPKDADAKQGPVKLVGYKETAGWIGEIGTWRTPSPEVAFIGRYEGELNETCWLPDAYTAALWQAFVTHDSPVQIAAPQGVGGGKPFVQYAADKPIEVKLKVKEDLEADKIEIFDGDKRLAGVDRDATSVTLEGLPAGIYGLIAVATMSDGSKCYSPPKAMVVA